MVLMCCSLGWLAAWLAAKLNPDRSIKCRRVFHVLRPTYAAFIMIQVFQNTSYTEGWICDQCNKAFTGKRATREFYRCLLCKLDFCLKCKSGRPFPEVRMANFRHTKTSTNQVQLGQRL